MRPQIVGHTFCWFCVCRVASHCSSPPCFGIRVAHGGIGRRSDLHSEKTLSVISPPLPPSAMGTLPIQERLWLVLACSRCRSRSSRSGGCFRGAFPTGAGSHTPFDASGRFRGGLDRSASGAVSRLFTVPRGDVAGGRHFGNRSRRDWLRRDVARSYQARSRIGGRYDWPRRRHRLRGTLSLVSGWCAALARRSGGPEYCREGTPCIDAVRANGDRPLSLAAVRLLVFEHFLDAQDVTRALLHQLPPRLCQVAQLLDRRRWDQTGADQAVRKQIDDPCRVVHMGVATGRGLDVAGVGRGSTRSCPRADARLASNTPRPPSRRA